MCDCLCIIKNYANKIKDMISQDTKLYILSQEIAKTPAEQDDENPPATKII